MNLDRATILDAHIRGILNEDFGVDLHMIVPQSRLREDLGLDAVEAVEFMGDLMETFIFDLSSDECEAVRTVQQAIDVVLKHTSPDGDE